MPPDEDEDEMLRLALAESLQLSTQHQQTLERETQREAALLQQSADTEQKLAQQRDRTQRQQEEQEDEVMRRIMRESERVEEERVARRRDELRRMDELFGSRSSFGPGVDPNPTPVAATTGTTRRRRRRRRDAAVIPQPQPQPQPQPIVVLPRQWVNPPILLPPQPIQQPQPQPIVVHPRHPPQPIQQLECPRRRRRRRNPRDNPEPTALEDPGHYSLADVLRQSMRDTSGAAAQEEGFNRGELEAAIAASAEQNRDEEQEAIERNSGIPTYEEACAAPVYRAPRGARYVFQGPCKVEGEDGRAVMEVVGEMDLGEALRVANRDVRRKKRRER